MSPLVNPVPRVVVDGQVVATTAAAAQARQVTVLDSLMTTWGRRAVADHHEAQQAKFSVLDFGQWSDRATDLMGLPVTFEWTDPASGTSRVFFRGRIGLRESTPRRPSKEGEARGAIVDITCMGKLTEAAQVLTGTESWPDETGAARVQRLRSQLVPAHFASVDYRAFWGGAPMAARKVDRTQVMGLLRAMYDTAGADRMAYDPHTNTLGPLLRSQISGPSRAYLVRGADGLVQIRARGNGANGPNSGPMIEARYLEGAGKITRGLDTLVSRVDTSYAFNGSPASFSLAGGDRPESRYGRQTLNLSTELAAYNWAVTCATDWYSVLNAEGSQEAPEPMTYRADLAGGFPTLEVAQRLIGGVEVGGSAVFPAGSLWSGLGNRMSFTVSGGTIVYVGGGWRSTINLLPFSIVSGYDQITNDQLAIGADAFTLDDLHPAISFDDLEWVAG